MGKSLNVHNSGLHIAFAGGTGILPFMDLVAQVAYFVLSMPVPMTDKPADRLQEDFRLRLFVSFQTREDAIGLPLLEAL